MVVISGRQKQKQMQMVQKISAFLRNSRNILPIGRAHPFTYIGLNSPAVSSHLIHQCFDDVRWSPKGNRVQMAKRR